MNTLTIAIFACLAVVAVAKPSGHWDDGHWGGHWDDGSWDDGHWDGGWDGGHSNVVHGNGATLVGPTAGHSVVSGPSGHLGGWGGDYGWGGHGWAGHGGWGGHGVVVAGPHTVPATIVGPAGKVHADGLYGVGHGHGHHGHW